MDVEKLRVAVSWVPANNKNEELVTSRCGCLSNGRGDEHQEPGWHVAACIAARVRPLHSGKGWPVTTPHSVLPAPRSGTTSGP